MRNTEINRLAGVMLVFGLLLSEGAFAQQNPSHNYVNTNRSSFKTRLFVSQGVEGEYGNFKLSGGSAGSGTVANSALPSSRDSIAKWQGYNFSSTVGLETLKFVQFIASHSSLNMRSVTSSLESLKGSRLSGGARLVFLAPVANLEVGGGFIATRYDYQKDLSTADFYGSGFYYTMGMNYFMTDQISVYSTAKFLSEHSVKNGGNAAVDTLSVQTTNLGLGFSIWL